MNRYGVQEDMRQSEAMTRQKYKYLSEFTHRDMMADRQWRVYLGRHLDA